MKNRQEQPNREVDQPFFALLIAFLGGLAISFYVGSALLDFESIGEKSTWKLPDWQVNMGSICVGMMAFVVILFCLEILRKRSKIAGWRSSWPWLPLVGLTALATFVHIPVYLIISVGVLYSIWAYSRICKVSGLSTSRLR